MASRAAVLSSLLLAAVALPARAEVRVQVAGASVELTATAAPLAEVLDRLSKQTGMKVVYEGPAPRQLVTLTVRDRTPAQTVLAVLEGQGVNFALVTDATGAAVQTLLVTGAASSSGSSGGSAPARAAAAPSPFRQPFGPPPAPGVDAEPPFEEGDEEEPVSFGVPPEGMEQQLPTENPPGPPGQNAPAGRGAPAGQSAPAAYPGPVAPPQQFPVSPFAPQPVTPVPPRAATPAPNQGTAPSQNPPQ